ncbi:MAG: hypothetical protein H6Q20_1932 [Bacteroidetes bacterium]|nr:hypothetical protein [Bacteroidota bacterium]
MSYYLLANCVPANQDKQSISTVPIGIGGSRISCADLRFTLSAAADSERSLRQLADKCP